MRGQMTFCFLPLFFSPKDVFNGNYCHLFGVLIKYAEWRTLLGAPTSDSVEHVLPNASGAEDSSLNRQLFSFSAEAS